MSFRRSTRDDDFERLLRGGPLAADAAFPAAAVYVRGLEAAYPRESVPADVEAGHVAAMAAEGRRVAQHGAGDARLVRRPRRVRLAVKLAAATAAFVLLFSGLALAGTLPASLQALASRAAEAVGLHVPQPGADPEPTGGELSLPSPEARPATTQLQSATPRPAPATHDKHASGSAQGTAAQGHPDVQSEDADDDAQSGSPAADADQGESDEQRVRSDDQDQSEPGGGPEDPAETSGNDRQTQDDAAPSDQQGSGE